MGPPVRYFKATIPACPNQQGGYFWKKINSLLLDPKSRDCSIFEISINLVIFCFPYIFLDNTLNKVI